MSERAAGYVGTFRVAELNRAGHQAVGLTRSGAGTRSLVRCGPKPFCAAVNGWNAFRTATEGADGLIRAAFNNGFAKLKQNSKNGRRVIEALGEALTGYRPLVISAGTGLVRSKTDALPTFRAPPPGRRLTPSSPRPVA